MSDLDLFILALKGQAKFIYDRLPKKEQLVFAAEMDNIISHAQTAASFAHAINAIEGAALLIKRPMFFKRLFKDDTNIRELAHHIALVLGDSFKIRFIDGGSKFYLGLYENRHEIKINKK